MTHVTKILLSVVLLLVLDAQARTCPVPAHSMRFKPRSEGVPFSFFNHEGQQESVKTNVKMPRIIIQVLDSDGNLDTSTPGITITASPNSGKLSTEGQTVAVHRGEAHFTSLVLESILQGGSSKFFTLNFTASVGVSGRSYPIDGQAINTGINKAITKATELWRLRFPEDRNFVSYDGAPITIVKGTKFPTIRLEIITTEFKRFATDSLLDNNFTVRAEFAVGSGLPSDVALCNQVEGEPQDCTPTARAMDGEITFSDLVVVTESTYTELPPINFVLDRDPSKRASTGTISVVKMADYSNIAFESESSSFIYGEGQSLTAQGGVALPSIKISLRDTMYRKSEAATGVVITASCSKNPDMLGTIVGVVDGIATFDELTFNTISNDEFQPYTLTFRAGRQGSLPLGGKVLKTGVILVSRIRMPAASIRFRQNPYDSFFTEQGQDVETVLRTPTPAVAIELLDSANQLDSSTQLSIYTRMPQTTSSSVSCTSDSGMTKAGFVNGVATFDSLLFTVSSKDLIIRLTFMACGNNSVGSYETSLLTGIIKVTTSPTSNAEMRFQPNGVSLFSRPGIASFATVRRTLPPIVIEMTTSTGAMDSSSSDIGITATAPGVVIDNAFLRVTNGVAIFRELSIVTESVSQFRLTFTAGNEGGSPVAGKRLITGKIDLVPALTPSYGIKFANDSYIAYEGHVMPVTLTQFNGSDATTFIVPPIKIQLVQSDHTGQSSLNDTLAQDLYVSVSLSSGSFTSGDAKQSLASGLAVFNQLAVQDAFDPVMTFCVESSSVGSLAAIEGRCISSGSLSALPTRGVGGIKILSPQESGVPGVITNIATPLSLYLNQPFPVAVGIVDSTGVFVPGPPMLPASIKASSNVQLSTPLTIEVNETTGIAYFDSLRFVQDVPAGLTPIITFTAEFEDKSARRVPHITSGTISVIGGAGQDAGVDVVAEILFNDQSFDWEGWRARLCRRLNIEVARVLLLNKGKGTSAEANPSMNEDNINSLKAAWEGTRVEFRVTEPLPTSRTTKKAQELVDIIIALKTNSDTTADLFLRRAFMKKDDKWCDFAIYDKQNEGALACIEVKGKAGYCDCYVPMFEQLGKKCLGHPDLTTLCLETLLPLAECTQPVIEDNCRLLEFPDAPRTELAGSGVFLFLFMPPLIYLYVSGFFHKLSRPSAKKSRIQRMELVTRDAGDLL